MSILENEDYAGLDWRSFVGNAIAVKQLRVAATSAKMRHVPLPHCLIEGGYGLGKTTLAVLVAKEMGASVREVSGALKANEARVVLSSMSDGDVLFIDECHGLVVGGKAKAEWLLNYLADGVISVGGCTEEMPKVTIIGASNEVQKLPETILSRFQLRVLLSDYSLEEAAEIARTMVPRLFGSMPTPSDEVLYQVAVAANANPRIGRQILANVRDLSLVNNEIPKNGDYPLQEALDLMDLTADGLNKVAREYLVTLLRYVDGVGQTVMNELLGQTGTGNMLAATERQLLNMGFLIKLKSGRTLSSSGIRRANEILKAEKAVQLAANHTLIA